MCVMQRCGGCPMVIDVPCGRKDIMALPEIIGGLFPICTIAHQVSVSQIIAFGIFGGISIITVSHCFIQGVILSEPCVI